MGKHLITPTPTQAPSEAPTSLPTPGLAWSRYGGDNSKCLNEQFCHQLGCRMEKDVPDAAAFHAIADARGDAFVSYSPVHKRCLSSSSCDAPVTNTVWDWMMFKKHLITPTPTQAPSEAPTSLPTPGLAWSRYGGDNSKCLDGQFCHQLGCRMEKDVPDTAACHAIADARGDAFVSY